MRPFLSGVPCRVSFGFLVQVIRLSSNSRLVTFDLKYFRSSAVNEEARPDLMIEVILGLHEYPVPNIWERVC